MARRAEAGSGNPQRGDTGRRWPRKRLLALVLLGALLWLARPSPPSTPLLASVARLALADFPGSLRIGGASLGWLSAPVLEDVEVSRRRRPAAPARAARGGEPLTAGAVMGRRRPGHLPRREAGPLRGLRRQGDKPGAGPGSLAATHRREHAPAARPALRIELVEQADPARRGNPAQLGLRGPRGLRHPVPRSAAAHRG